MTDQATTLRNLIGTTEVSDRGAPADLPMVVVTGGRAGVGATTVAVNLAAAMADRGERVALVDADEQRNNLIEVAGIRVRSYSDEILFDGPVGMRVLATRNRVFQIEDSPWRKPDSEFRPSTSSAGARNSSTVVQLMSSVRDEVDVFVVDTGSGLTATTRRLWSRASLVLLVTTPEQSSLLDTYAQLKQSFIAGVGGDVRLLVNQAFSDKVATDAQRRISGAAERFLSRNIVAMPALPCEVIDSGAGNKWPRVWEEPNTPFGHAVLWLGREVIERMQDAGCRGRGQGSLLHSASRILVRTKCDLG
jgi:flagellar biosynthesis protein FlhG